MGPKAKKATTTKKKGATKSKAAAKPVKYTPIKTIKVKENTVFVRTFEDIASIYEEENDKRYFYYRKIAKQLSETDEAITEPTYHVEGVDMVGEKLHDTLEKIIETGTLPKIAEHKKLQSEKDSPMEELTEEFIETIGKQVQKIFEGFFSSCLDWTGGDDSLEYHMKLKNVTGFSATNCDDGSETLVVQRVDKVPFSVTLKQRALQPAVSQLLPAFDQVNLLFRPVSSSATSSSQEGVDAIPWDHTASTAQVYLQGVHGIGSVHTIDSLCCCIHIHSGKVDLAGL